MWVCVWPVFRRGGCSRSPLTHGVVDLVALAAADGYGVKILERAQTHTRDSHQGPTEEHQDGLGAVEGHAQVMDHRDHQGVVPAAQAPVSWEKHRWNTPSHTPTYKLGARHVCLTSADTLSRTVMGKYKLISCEKKNTPSHVLTRVREHTQTTLSPAESQEIPILL